MPQHSPDRTLVVTVDVEEDISTVLKDSYLGVQEGVPMLLDLFDDMGVRACFFLLGRICERFPDVAAQISQSGHQIGNHGYRHVPLYFKSFRWQLRELGNASAVIAESTGVRPKVFRAARFSATSRTIRVLEQLGYEVDSSILQGHKATLLRGMITIRSTLNVPEEPYRPSRSDILKPGTASVHEVPVTSNPLQVGAPLGMGALNAFGTRRMMEALDFTRSRFVTLVIHPWELVDLGALHPGLPDWVRALCEPNRDGLHDFLSYAERRFNIGDYTAVDLASIN